MPIHDHPNMTVFTKLVHGNLHVKTFTVLQEDTGSVRRAHVTLDKICSASPWPVASLPERDSPPSPAHSNSQRSSNVHTHSSESDTLFAIRPSDGPNLHSFTSVSDFTVIMDIMGPPYLLGERDITYYTELSASSCPSSNPVSYTCRCQDSSLFISASHDTAFQHHQRSPPFEQRNGFLQDSALSVRKRSHSDSYEEATSQRPKTLEPVSSDKDGSLHRLFLETSTEPILIQETSIQACIATQLKQTVESSTQASSSSERSTCTPTPPVTPCNCDLPTFPLPEGIVHLKVEPNSELDCVEVEYSGLPVWEFSTLLGKIGPCSPADRIMNIVQIAERVGKAFDRILD
ncbi:hypothetical protein BC830DRAFT_1153277 [Chytriomyces sp. MP71]|nr:hypothetical protein BC830DRAFT_1153277 [Chytriomyces sp. MP71]